jgi:23S rRNA pseudouridine2605 synthase
VRQRLQRLLAAAGIASRRGAEELVRAGRVTVDGRVAGLGESADPDTQDVRFDGRPIRPAAHEYWLLNKPGGTVTTARDPQGRRTVIDFIPTLVRVFPVGRLDLDTTGVLLLTNDGELTHRLLHPRFGVEKEYVATVRGPVEVAALAALRRGLMLEDGPTAPAQVTLLEAPRGETRLALVIHEGRKRQVKRMLEAVGHPVLGLHRRRFGPLTDEGLAVGQARPLHEQELGLLKETAELPGRGV